MRKRGHSPLLIGSVPFSVEVAAFHLDRAVSSFGRQKRSAIRCTTPSCDLQPPGHAEERRGLHDHAVLLEHLRPHDDVHEAGLVLERQEHDARRGARPLPADDDARRSACAGRRGSARTVARVGQALRAQRVAQRRERMARAERCIAAR